MFPKSDSDGGDYLQGIAVVLGAGLAVSALLEPVDAFRRAEDAPRIAVPCNSTAARRQLHDQELHNVINYRLQ